MATPGLVFSEPEYPRLGQGAEFILERESQPSWERAYTIENLSEAEVTSNNKGDLLLEVAFDEPGEVQLIAPPEVDISQAYADGSATVTPTALDSTVNVESANEGTALIVVPQGQSGSIAAQEINNETVLVRHKNNKWKLVIDVPYEGYKNEGSTIHAYMVKSDEAGGEVSPTPSTSKPRRFTSAVVKAKVTYPNGSKKTIKLYDSGEVQHNDKKKGDGIYSANILMKGRGETKIKVKYKGTKSNGKAIRRVARDSITSVPFTATIKKQIIQATPGRLLSETVEDDHYGLPVTVKTGDRGLPKEILVEGEVWATQDSEYVPVGFIGGIMKPHKKSNNKYVIPLSFHSGWLDQGEFSAPYELRKISIESTADSHAELVRNKKRTLVIEGLPETSTSKTLKSTRTIQDNTFNPTYEMLTGMKASPRINHPRRSTRSLGKTKGVSMEQKKADLKKYPIVLVPGWCTVSEDRDIENLWSKLARAGGLAFDDEYVVRFDDHDDLWKYDLGNPGIVDTAKALTSWVNDKVRAGKFTKPRAFVGHSMGAVASLYSWYYHGTLESYAYHSYSKGKDEVWHRYSTSAPLPLYPVQGINGMFNGSKLAEYSRWWRYMKDEACPTKHAPNGDMQRKNTRKIISAIPGPYKRFTGYYTSVGNHDHRVYGAKWCSRAASPILSGADDGVLRWGDQELSGGTKVEHYYGFCHSSADMNHPSNLWNPKLPTRLYQGSVRDNWSR